MARRRIRDYVAEYLRRQQRAREQGFRSYGEKRYAQEKREATRRGLKSPAELREVRRQQRQQRPTPIRRAPRAFTRRDLEREATRNFRRHFGTVARPRTIDENVRRMSQADLRTAATASADQLRRLARRPPTEQDADGNPLNPFWYH
jgi:hypothetical protein